MIPTLCALFEACLCVHIDHGPPVAFAWAVYESEPGVCKVALAPSNPPIWEGDEEGVERAKDDMARIINATGIVPANLPAHAPSLAWQASSAHDRIASAQQVLRLTEALSIQAR